VLGDTIVSVRQMNAAANHSSAFVPFKPTGDDTTDTATLTRLANSMATMRWPHDRIYWMYDNEDNYTLKQHSDLLQVSR
jgi:hypothetical protein